MHIPEIASIVYGINILLAILIIFFERRSPTTTLAWIMVLIFIPGLGFVLYLFLGQNLSRAKLFTSKASEDVVYKKYLHENLQNLLDEKVDDPNVLHYKELVEMNIKHGQSILTQDNHITIFSDGTEKFNALFTSIENAKQHIHLVYYILRNDELGVKLMKHLTTKAQEGVEVRLLYDGMGGLRLPHKLFKELVAAGGHIAVFFPPFLPYINLRINYRNHRKIAIIDGNDAYVGGFNIGNEYLGLDSKFGYWRDTHLRIQGSAAINLQIRFLLDWRHASVENMLIHDKYFPFHKPKGTSSVQIVSSGPDSRIEGIKNGFLKIINSARHSLYIQTPYFVPDDSIFDALKIASFSGVDVRIMIPCKPDHPFVYWASYSFIGELIQAGIKCYTYQNGFLHSKTIMADGKVASVGTSNMDNRSFKLNFEVNAFIYDTKVVQELEQNFIDDIDQSLLVTPVIYSQRSLWIKIKESVSRLLAPVL